MASERCSMMYVSICCRPAAIMPDQIIRCKGQEDPSVLCSARLTSAGRPVFSADHFQSHLPTAGLTVLAFGFTGLQVASNRHCAGSFSLIMCSHVAQCTEDLAPESTQSCDTRLNVHANMSSKSCLYLDLAAAVLIPSACHWRREVSTMQMLRLTCQHDIVLNPSQLIISGSQH